MSWSDIVGHRANIDRFASMVARGRLASSFLFSGPPGIGKHTFALELAKALLCESSSPAELNACDNCLGCVQVAARTHPDLILVERPEDKNQIPVEKFIGPEEKRMQEGLCYDLGLKPFRGGRKVAVINDADYLNQEGANCLLKTLEEPPPQSILILVGTTPQKQLPTIRSRCQWVPFSPLSQSEIETVLTRKKLVDDPAQARHVAELSGGSIERAVLMKDEQVVQFRSAWFESLATHDPARQQFAKTVTTFVDAAGTDAALRRDRMRLVCDLAVDFFRGVLQTKTLGIEPDESVLASAVAVAIESGAADESTVARCLERCLDAYSEIAANVNPALWTECLLIDLGRLSRGDVVALERTT